MVKKILILLLIILVGFIGYNYYYYYESLKINKNVYYELKTVVDDFNKSLESLEDSDILGFLNNNYQMIKHSNYLKLKNHRIYNNIFVKINMLDGSLFSNEVSEALLWFNDFNTKLNDFYILNDELFNNSILVKDSSKAMSDVKNIRSVILELNTLLSIKNPRILNMKEDQKLDNKYFGDLEKRIQLSYNFYEIIDNFMGAKKKFNTLVLVQNTHNMNQSGGKWVYYLSLSCLNYKCEISDIDFVSNLTSAMVDKLIPPEEIRTKKTIWNFEDLGWFLNFNDSANLASKYYPIKTEFDGVIAVNISFFEKLINNIKPIDIEVLDDKITVNKGNIVEFLLELIQYKNNKDLINNTEKLSVFWDNFLKNFDKNNSNIKYLISGVYNLLEKKEIQLYTNKNVIQPIKDLGYNNFLKKIENVDFFAISKSNILDKAFDKNVNYKVNLKVDIDNDYSVKNMASVTVNNSNSSKIKDQIISYFQFYVYKGSKLDKTSFPSKMGASKNSTVDYEKHGFITDKKIDTINTRTAYLASDDVRVYEDGDFLITGGWVITNSNQSKKIEFDWSSDYIVDKKEKIYRLFVQKQANVDYVLSLEINYPSESNGKNTITKNINIDSDKLIEIKID